MEKLQGELSFEEGYFDPFAENGAEEFDPVAVFAELEQNYLEDKVVHDTAADEFVAKTEALMMDTVFVERFDQAQQIAARMHELCGEDHGLNQSAQSNQYLADSFHSLYKDDGHNHHSDEADKHKHDDNEGTDSKKKSKSKNRWRTWREIILGVSN